MLGLYRTDGTYRSHGLYGRDGRNGRNGRDWLYRPYRAYGAGNIRERKDRFIFVA